jgi:hypothetical protein
MTFQIRKAERSHTKMRLGLIGPSGSGKTYSSLLVARGLVGDKGKICLIDTESESGAAYSDLINYDILNFEPPFTAQRYLKAVQFVESSGYDICILDSLAHAWMGQGGLLELHDKAKSKYGGNSFAAWADVTPWHRKLVDAILRSSIHMFVTIRTKTAYEIQEQNGKKVPVKLGLAPEFRAGIEYEFTTVLDISVDKHIASATKDRTGIFDGLFFKPSVETGQMIAKWISGAKDLAPVKHESKAEPPPEPASESSNNGNSLAKIYQLAKEFHMTDDAWKKMVAAQKITKNKKTHTKKRLTDLEFNIKQVNKKTEGDVPI